MRCMVIIEDARYNDYAIFSTIEKARNEMARINVAYARIYAYHEYMTGDNDTDVYPREIWENGQLVRY